MQDDIINEAMQWIDTPFHLHQNKKGIAVDCCNFVVGVGVNLGYCLPLPDYILNYTSRPNPNHLIKWVENYFYQVAKPQHGDVVCVAWRRNLPMHLGIYLGENKIIHASQQIKKVTIQRINQSQMHSFWRYKKCQKIQ